MKKLLHLLPLLAALSLTTVSCVSSRKFQEETAARQKSEQARSQAETDKATADKARVEAEQQIPALQKQIGELQIKHDKLQAAYDIQLRRNDDLQITNDRLNKTYKDLLDLNERYTRDADSRKKEIAEELVKKEALLQKREIEMAEKEAQMRRDREQLDRLTAQLKDKDGNLADLETIKRELMKDLADREKRVAELEKAIADRDAKSKALRESLNEALRGFQASDLTVEERDGKVYVSLSQNLLFASGSYKLDPKGIDALQKLANVLNKNAEISVLIEGHTDTDGDAKSNWKLSTERSLSIIDELVKAKVAPEHLTAGGRGQHAPIAPNSTPDGKAKNRRTEIILTPRLDVVYGLLKGK
jgi:chemotaxis protein MotB